MIRTSALTDVRRALLGERHLQCRGGGQRWKTPFAVLVPSGETTICSSRSRPGDRSANDDYLLAQHQEVEIHGSRERQQPKRSKGPHLTKADRDKTEDHESTWPISRSVRHQSWAGMALDVAPLSSHNTVYRNRGSCRMPCSGYRPKSFPMPMEMK
jgi:hypothetical protein